MTTKKSARQHKSTASTVPVETPVAAVNSPTAVITQLPIVAIGASAGGLEAIEAFLRHTPALSGMAYIVIQHLDPTQKGMLVELLQRATPMPVMQVTDSLPVEANTVYVIPPNKDMSILHGVLHLLSPIAPRGLRLPIDYFLRSLADDQQENSIGVILSGMGTDGTLGLRAIKEKAGVAFVQAPTSAAFDGMPHSAIEAGLADVVAPVEELPGRILSYLQRAPHPLPTESLLEDKLQSALDKVFILLRSQTGHDFTAYKKSTVYRRIERRMGVHQIDRIATYVRYLQENRGEVDLLFRELLIGVTSFFRDPAVWEQLRKTVVPEILANHSPHQPVRIWVAGCSTGEEAYSLAILFKEVMELQQPPLNIPVQIFATDLDRDAIDRARQGNYPVNIAADVTPERLQRFFVKDENSYRVTKGVREMVIFAPQNVMMDPPFTKLDLLSCRNLLIYLTPEPQQKLIQLFSYSLKPAGVLLLGSAETIGARTDLFSAVDSNARLYRRLDPVLLAESVSFPISVANIIPGTQKLPRISAPFMNLQSLAEQVLLRTFTPSAVLVNESGDIIYISGRTGKYLEPAAGQANWNIFAMAREGLRSDLFDAFQRASRQKDSVTVRGIKVDGNDGSQYADLTIQWLAEPEGLRGLIMIVFVETNAPPVSTLSGKRNQSSAHSTQVAALEQSLLQARDNLQTTREQMQTTQEELKSANEELQSTNEELQSTNEELTTSKEEMQSMNEELQTVNHELQAKVDELSRSNNDMKNLLNSTDIATLFLDNNFRIRRFTTQTTRLIKLIPTDVGRDITDIASDLLYPELITDAQTVIQSLVFSEKPIATREGGWFMVRIMPYRTLDNRIDGVVITFSDITASKVAEALMRDTESYLHQLMNTMPHLFWISNSDGTCETVSPQWIAFTGIPETGLLGNRWNQVIHPDDREQVKAQWAAHINAGVTFDIDFRIQNQHGAYRQFRAHELPIHGTTAKLIKWYGYCTEIEEPTKPEPQNGL